MELYITGDLFRYRNKSPYRLTAFSHYAHGVEKQHRRIFSIAKCCKPHDRSPPFSVIAVSFC